MTVELSWLRLIFWIVAAVYVGLGLRLAAVAANPGGWDSTSNLVAARNLAEGRGFTTDMVQDLIVVHPLPGPETVRAPGAVYLLAGAFKIAGLSLAVPVIVTTLLILLAAIVLRRTVAELGPTWLGDLTGVLLLLGNHNFVLSSYLNNNLLVLLVVLALALAVRVHLTRPVGWWVAITTGVLTAGAFLVKQTYVLSFGPFAIVLILSMHQLPWRRRAVQLVLAGAVTVVLTAPYWAVNFLRHGSAIHSPIQSLRLPVRYGTVPIDGYQRTVLFNEPPATYRSIAEQIGIHGMLRRDLDIARDVADALIGRGLLVILWATGALVFVRPRQWPFYGAAGALCIAPFFDSIWWVPEDRYLYPLYALLLFVAAVGSHSYLALSASEVGGFIRNRMRVAFGALLALLFVSSLLGARWGWRAEFAAARVATPGWVEHVRRTPANAVVLTSAVPYVPWWTRRRSVIEPWGTDPAHLDLVMETYRPTHYLDTSPGPRADRPAFEAGDLTPIGRGQDWALFRIHRAGR